MALLAGFVIAALLFAIGIYLLVTSEEWKHRNGSHEKCSRGVAASHTQDETRRSA